MIRISMTPEAFAAKAAQLKNEQGIELSGQEGTIAKDGVTASYSFDGKTLLVSVLHKPMFYPMATVESKLTAWLGT